MELTDLVLRCYTQPKKVRRKHLSANEEKDNRRILVLDTETSVDLRQSLKFGSFAIYGRGELAFRGIFYDNVDKGELVILQGYIETMKADSQELALMTAREFVDKVLLPEVYDLKTLCVGFNLPFDLSRLAISWGNARRSNRGGFSFKMIEDPRYPRLIVKNIDSRRAFIQFANGLPEGKFSNSYRKGRRRTFRGRFLDLKTLAFALTDRSHSLLSAGKRFGCSVLKSEAEEHGCVTDEYIAYNLNDVAATYDLFLHMDDDFRHYHLDKPANRLYSPASIGKDYLDRMGVTPFLQRNPDFPPDILGCLMNAFYGGRSEVRVRKTPVDVVVLDFLSMYPTVCILQDMWHFFIASKVEAEDDTEEVRRFLETVDLVQLAKPETWKRLKAICLVLPDEDVFPARCSYGSAVAYNIGINCISSEKAIWYSLADVIASKLLGGKTPTVVKALRVVTLRQQRGLHPIEIIGGRKVDPRTEDFFLALMEYRHELKGRLKSIDRESSPDEYDRIDNMQKTVKTIANATAYGIAVQVNVTETDGNGEVDVYTGDTRFTVSNDTVETPGEHFNPSVAVFVTSAARLVLAITEHLLEQVKATYAYCDTDGIGVPKEHAKMIQDYFQNLTPYSFDDPIFKIERDGTFLGISAKRYAIYKLDGRKVEIIDAKSHGLGHIIGIHQKRNAEDGDKDSSSMSEEIWKDIISYHLGILDADSFSSKYAPYHIISKLAISSPHVMSRFKCLNKGKNYAECIKPFNFALVGSQCVMDERRCQPIKPIAPFRKDFTMAPYDEFIDYNSGERMRGEVYWRTLDEYLWGYMNHKEAKFEGDIGTLQRRHLRVRDIVYIGKESNRLDEVEVLGVQGDEYTTYVEEGGVQKDTHRIAEFVISLTNEEAGRHGINPRQLQRWKKTLAAGKPLELYSKTRRKLEQANRTAVQADSSHICEELGLVD